MLLVAAAAASRGSSNASAGMRHDLPFAIFYLSNLVPMSSLLAITWSLSTRSSSTWSSHAGSTRVGRCRSCCPRLRAGEPAALRTFSGLRLPGFFRQTTFGPILLGVAAHVLDDRLGFAFCGGRWSSSGASPGGRPVCWRCAPTRERTWRVATARHPRLDDGAPRSLGDPGGSHPASDPRLWPIRRIGWSATGCICST